MASFHGIIRCVTVKILDQLVSIGEPVVDHLSLATIADILEPSLDLQNAGRKPYELESVIPRLAGKNFLNVKFAGQCYLPMPLRCCLSRLTSKN